MFLTLSDLVALTGYRMKSKQITWLQRNGVPHYVNANGKPVVPESLTKPVKLRPKLGRVS